MPADDVELAHDDFRDAGLPPVSGAASRTLVRFFHQPYRVTEMVKQKDGTEVEEFRWKKREMVEVRVPGDRYNAPTKIVDAEVRQRYAAAYRAWKAGEDQNTAGGWPLAQWPGVDVAQVEALKAAKCYTVEHVAALSDDNLGRLGPGWRQVRQAAQDFLAAAKSAAPLAALRAENEKMRNLLEANQRQMEVLQQALEKLQRTKKDAKEAA